MLTASSLSLLALFFAGDPDTVLTRKIHTDAATFGDREIPARDQTQMIWMRGTQQMRVEDGDRVTIIRLDEKKLHFLNTKEKMASTVDLPFDVAKFLGDAMGGGRQGRGGEGGGRGEGGAASRPEGGRAGGGAGGGGPRVTLKPTEETKKIKDWNAKKYTVAREGGFGGGGDETIWASNDLGIDSKAFQELMAQIPSMGRGVNNSADEMKKLEGVPVLVERVRRMGDTEQKTTEEIVSVEKKEAPAGAFDVPADFEKKPFDARTMLGGRGGRGPGGPGGEGGRGPGGGRGPRNEGGAAGPASKPAEK